MRELKEIILHCTATPPTTTVESIRNYHVNVNGWNDIGYHYLIQHGVVKTGRTLEKIGAHCKGHNTGTIGIAYIGTHPTLQDVVTLATLCNQLISKYGIKKISKHCDYANKTCPNFSPSCDKVFNRICNIKLK